MSIKSTAIFRTPFLDPKRFTSKIEGDLNKEMKNAIEAWLKAVLIKVPVYTGTSKGTFAPVGRVIGKAVKAISPVNKAASSKKFFKYRGRKFPLGFNAGRDYGSASLTREVLGKIITFTFTFANTLPYTVWNEQFPGPDWFSFRTEPPWNALIAGKEAFVNHVKKEMFHLASTLDATVQIKVIKVR